MLDKRKVDLKFEEIVLKIIQSSNFLFSEIDWSLIMETNKIKGPKDLHDRIIIASAKIFNAPVISKDKIVKKFYKETIW